VADELLDERIAAGAIKKAGFTASGTLREVRHQPKETMLIIGYASIIVPAEYRNSESIIFNRAIR
jgi:hypothetical protein